MAVPAIVIPGKAGIQLFATNIELPTLVESFLDPDVRRDDEIANFFITHLK